MPVHQQTSERVLHLSVHIPFLGNDEDEGKMAERVKHLLALNYNKPRVFKSGTDGMSEVHLHDHYTGQVID